MSKALFPRADWLRWIAGFDARRVRFDHPELEPGQYEAFVGHRPPD